MRTAEHSKESLVAGPGAHKTLYRFVVVPSWIIFVVLTLGAAAGVEVPEAVRYAPFAFSIVLFGLPHGAVDHLVPGRLAGVKVSGRSVLTVVLLYLLLSSAYLVGWYATPELAFVFFILLTWFHWGQGDLYSVLGLMRGQHLGAKLLKNLTVLTRGGLPMLVPLLAFPGVYEEVARTIVTLFSDAMEIGWAFSPVFRWSAGVVYLSLALFTLAWGYFAAPPHDKKSWGLDALEVGILMAYFAVVPPIFALGMYFSLWHAPRHIARLMLIDRDSKKLLEKGAFRKPLWNFVRDSAPLTLAATLLLVGLYLAVPGGVQGVLSLLAVYLVLISVLTLPHVAIVMLMDLRQGLWR